MKGNGTRQDPARIGGFLVGVGAMKGWQVDDILDSQRKGDCRLFGEIAIERGYIDDAALKRYVDTVAALGSGSVTR